MEHFSHDKKILKNTTKMSRNIPKTSTGVTPSEVCRLAALLAEINQLSHANPDVKVR